MSLKILLADDSLTAQNMGKKILTEAGYEVIAVSNGAQAIKKIVSDRPDLVVLDVYMPGYSGVELCERMRNTRETATTPVVLSVGKMEAFKPEEGTRVRADGLIVKPFEATELLAVVKKLSQRVPQAKGKPAVQNAPEEEPENSTAEAEPVAPQKLQVPQEIAATPVIGMELIPQEPEVPAAPIEFEVERHTEPEPAQPFDRPKLVSAEGFSGVFEVEAPRSVAEEPAVKPVVGAEPGRPTESAEAAAVAAPEEAHEPVVEAQAQPAEPEPSSVKAAAIEIAAVEAPTAEIAAVQEPAVAEQGATVEYDFDAVAAGEFAVEAAVVPEMSSAPEAVITQPPDLPSEVEAHETEQFAPAAVGACAAPSAVLESTVGVGEALPADFEAEIASELSSWQDPPEAHHREEPPVAAQQHETGPANVWVAEETQLAADESALTLHEEMQRSATAPPEPELAPELEAVAIEPKHVDPALAYYRPDDTAEAQSQVPPEPVVEAEMPEPITETVPEEIAQVPPPMITEAPADPARISAIVDQVLERLKPELIAAITLELQRNKNQ